MQVAAKMSAMMVYLGQLFICNITERILHACLQDLFLKLQHICCTS